MKLRSTLVSLFMCLFPVSYIVATQIGTDPLTTIITVVTLNIVTILGWALYCGYRSQQQWKIHSLKDMIRAAVREAECWENPLDTVGALNNEHLDRLGAELEDLIGERAYESFLCEVWNIGEVSV
jgi:hypothetical protein